LVLALVLELALALVLELALASGQGLVENHQNLDSIPHCRLQRLRASCCLERQ
jgi:hypothetical protein